MFALGGACWLGWAVFIERATLWVGRGKFSGLPYLAGRWYFCGGIGKKDAGGPGALHAPRAYPTPPNLPAVSVT